MSVNSRYSNASGTHEPRHFFLAPFYLLSELKYERKGWIHSYISLGRQGEHWAGTNDELIYINV